MAWALASTPLLVAVLLLGIAVRPTAGMAGTAEVLRKVGSAFQWHAPPIQVDGTQENRCELRCRWSHMSSRGQRGKSCSRLSQQKASIMPSCA